MADRGGAEAYAAGRLALRELSALNRRDRAAVWIARSLQNPLGELLKVDVNRLRLGSYQRELPQEPLRELVRDTIADCVSAQGIDAHSASVDALQYVAGVANEQAQQIASLAASGNLQSRQQLSDEIKDWPDVDKRQALAFLRVYASEQPLDATLIHPDDYQLAERLIAGTSLESPPGQPEGWAKPEPVTSDPVATEPATQPDTSETESSSAPTATGNSEASNLPAAETESKGAQTTETVPEVEPSSDSPPPEADSSAATEDSQAQASENETDSSEQGTPTAESAPVPSETEKEAQPSETPSEDEACSSESEPVPAEGPAENQDDDSQPSVAANPEYPEDVTNDASGFPDIDIEKIARGWQVGREKLRWIALNLHSPFDDPRLRRPPVPMLSTTPTITTLEADTCVWAVVVGVADFGAFVEIAPDCSGLIHISRLSANYVEDPHQVVQVGDLIQAWVVSVDEKKNRVALTALSPAERAARPPQQTGRGRGRSQKSGGDHGAPHGHSKEGGRSGGRQQGGRGSRDPNRSGSRARSGRGRPDSRRASKPVIVTSKKPKAPISEAMKEGDEPLRSFSDLLQFYEAKRTDVPAPKSSEETKPADTPDNPGNQAEAAVSQTESDPKPTESEE